MASNATHNIISVAPRAASCAGAVPAFEARCACGYVAATSISLYQAGVEGEQHVAYFAAKAKPNRRAAVRA